MILIISATKGDEKTLDQTPLASSLNTPENTNQWDIINSDKKYLLKKINNYVNIMFISENSIPIGKAYNEAIDFVLNNHVIHGTSPTHILFIHDDVYIEDRHFESKVYCWLNFYNIIGLAGGTNVLFRECVPNLWHFISERKFGTVGHYVNGNWYGTTFGETDKRVTVIDGLFIGVKTQLLKEKKRVRFDSNIPGFHMYDIDFSLNANKEKCTIGVVPIICTHHSPGLLDLKDPNFIRCDKYFVSKYSIESSHTKI